MQHLNDTLLEIISGLQLDDAPAGGSVVVYHQGKRIAAASVGQATPEQGWGADTLSLNFSTGKGVLVTLIHILVSQGVLDYQQPIASDWPKFGQQGKQDITLKQVLTHRSGLYNIQSITESVEDMYDWSEMLTRVETMSAQQPNNTQAESVYSALVSGWVLGGLIEKATGLSLNEALDEYLATPLGVEGSLYFGVPTDKVRTVATLAKNFNDFDTRISPTALTDDESKTKSRSAKPVLRQDSEETLAAYQRLPSYECWQQLAQSEANVESKNTPLKTLEIAKLYFDMHSVNVKDFRHALAPTGRAGLDYYTLQALTAKIPAANNVASAEALARMYAMLANKGEWEGAQLIRPEVFEQLSTVYVTGPDAIMPAAHPQSMQWRLGYHRVFSCCQSPKSLSSAFGHMGYNGSVAWCDTKHQFSMAYVHNYDVTMSTDIRQFAIIEAVLQWLEAQD